MGKNPPAKDAGGAGSRGWEGPLERENDTNSSVLAGKVPGKEEPFRQQSMGSQKSQTGLSD